MARGVSIILMASEYGVERDFEENDEGVNHFDVHVL